MLKVGVLTTMLLLMPTIMHAYHDYPFAPANQGILIPPASRTSHSAAVFDHNMAPSRRSLQRAPIIPSKPNPATHIPGRPPLERAPVPPSTLNRGTPITDIDLNSIGETAEP